MIFLLIFALLTFHLDARFVNSPVAHFSGALKLKCDSLPYRTAYIGTRCYFAVTHVIKLEDAPAQCSSVLAGSKVGTNIPGVVFITMMLERSKFHNGKDSSGSSFQSTSAKQTICVYDSNYKCSDGEQSSVIPGKCLALDDEKRNFNAALMHCENQGMEMPTVENNLENSMIRGIISKNSVWIRNIYETAPVRKWKREKYFSKYGTCDRRNLHMFTGWQQCNVCHVRQSAVIDKAGYWGGGEATKIAFSTVCVKNAENEFTYKAKIPCAAHHKSDSESGMCEWTGPPDACVQLIDFYNRTWFMPMPDFPKKTFLEIAISPVNDVATTVIVRRGCMFSGFRHPRIGDGTQEIPSVLYRPYGTWHIPCQLTGDLSDYYDGISRFQCFCDPTEATLNDHVPTPPPKKKCIEHHVFDETTQSCEWKHESKFCAELITNDGRTKMLEIPNWPTNRKYDVTHWDNITDIIVRQHCWATLYQYYYHGAMTLPTVGYGRHQVKSYYNSLVSHVDHGTHRVVCECIR